MYVIQRASKVEVHIFLKKSVILMLKRPYLKNYCYINLQLCFPTLSTKLYKMLS